MKKFLAALAVASVLVVWGCGEKGASAESGGSTTAASGQNPAGTKVNGATVVNEPPRDGNIPKGGVVLKPSNPDDEKFKPDPRLAGGGGR